MGHGRARGWTCETSHGGQGRGGHEDSVNAQQWRISGWHGNYTCLLARPALGAITIDAGAPIAMGRRTGIV